MPGDEDALADRYQLVQRARALVGEAQETGAAAIRRARRPDGVGVENESPAAALAHEGRLVGEAALQLAEALRLLNAAGTELEERLDRLRAELRALHEERPALLERLRPSEMCLLAAADRFAAQTGEIECRLRNMLRTGAGQPGDPRRGGAAQGAD